MISRTVLLADADADSRAVYSLILEYHGFRVLEARETAEAHRMAREQRPDLVVAELFLPSPDGQPLVAFLKRDQDTAHLPVIGLTALSASLGVAPGLLACDSHLLKPCSPSRLLQEVQRLLEGPPTSYPPSVSRPPFRPYGSRIADGR